MQSKSHIPKVMFLACTGPTPVGIWRVSDDAIAIRDSVNRAKGTGYQKDVTMKKTKYLQMMEEQVFVALADAYPEGLPQRDQDHRAAGWAAGWGSAAHWKNEGWGGADDRGVKRDCCSLPLNLARLPAD